MKSRRRIKYLLLLIALVLLYEGVTRSPLVQQFVEDPEQFRSFILGFGIWAPLGVVLLHTFQTTFSIIPSQITTVLAGFIFGPLGLLYSLIGAIVGSAFVFLLSQRYGERLALRIFQKRELRHFHHFFRHRKSWALFLARVMPLFPNDIVSFVAGLTNMKFWTFNRISTAGFVVQMAILTYFGAELTTGSWLINVVLVLLVFLLVLAFIFKEPLVLLLIQIFTKLRGEAEAGIKKYNYYRGKR